VAIGDNPEAQSSSLRRRGRSEGFKALRRLLLAFHWALPAAATIGAGLLFGTHPLVICAIAVASLVLRPILAGPVLRAVFVVFALSPLLYPTLDILNWPMAKSAEAWAVIGTTPTPYIRLLYYLAFIIVIIPALFVLAVPFAILSPFIFKLIELENRARQRSRDRAAERIMSCLCGPIGTSVPRFSLYLRPFHTTGRLDSLSVGTTDGLEQETANIQIDFEAIFASAFPAHRPLIALGTPGALLSVKPEGVYTWPVNPDFRIPGTGKVASEEVDWRDSFALLARHAETIIIVPLKFRGTTWELSWLHQNDLLQKCIFFIPASPPGGHGYREAWTKVTDFIVSIGIAPPEYTEQGQLFLLHEGVISTFRFAFNLPLPRATYLFLLFIFLQRRKSPPRKIE
jgi:hypothetical protein